MTGSHHNISTNNYFNLDGNDTAVGGGVNDPSTNGTINDQEFTGNWLFASHVYFSSCEWRMPTYNVCAPLTADSSGMQVNGLIVNNNSVIGTATAAIDFRGNGCPRTGAGNVGTGPADCAGSTQNEMQCVNCSASNNYLSAPIDQYLIDSNSVSPSQINTYCAGGGSFSGCATSGFNTPPTVSFTLNPLGLGGMITFNAENFTAQYGAVQWLVSLSSPPPTASDTRWRSNNSSAALTYIPPYSLSGVSHGSTGYMWVMDSVNHISSPASQVVP